MSLVQQLVNGLMTGGIYALVGLGITLIFGLTHLVNFAQGELLMLGAYVSILSLAFVGGYWVVGLLTSMLAIGTLGLLLVRLVFGRTLSIPMNGLIVSLGLIIIFQNAAFGIWGGQPMTTAPWVPGVATIGGLRIANQRLLVLAITAGLMIGFFLFMSRTALGKALRAASQDAEVASLMGVPVRRLVWLTFAIGSGLSAAAGALLATLIPITPWMGAPLVMKGFAVALLGGLGSAEGAVAGGLILGVAEALGAGYISSAYRDAFGFIIMIAVLLFLPEGLFRSSHKREI